MKTRAHERLRTAVAAPCSGRPVYDWRAISAQRDAVVRGLRDLAGRLERAGTVAEIHRLLDEQLGAAGEEGEAA